MPSNFLYAGLIHATFPRARIIHMQRNPLDTCLSIYFQNFHNITPFTSDLGDLAHYYQQYVRIMNHWRNVLPKSSLLEVPYEALIEEPESWSRRMVDFLGLPWDPHCLAFHETERTVDYGQQMAGTAEDQQGFDRSLEALRRIPGPAKGT